MSLNKTLDRLFDEIRREARRNTDFADRLDAVLRAHASRRDGVSALEDMTPVQDAPEPEAEAKPVEASAEITAPPPKAEHKPAPKPVKPAAAGKQGFNPVGLYLRDGEEALAAKLGEEGLPDLLALVREHNLDPTGEAESLDREALAAHVLAQAKRRAERDKKLFDY